MSTQVEARRRAHPNEKLEGFIRTAIFWYNHEMDVLRAKRKNGVETKTELKSMERERKAIEAWRDQPEVKSVKATLPKMVDAPEPTPKKRPSGDPLFDPNNSFHVKLREDNTNQAARHLKKEEKPVAPKKGAKRTTQPSAAASKAAPRAPAVSESKGKKEKASHDAGSGILVNSKQALVIGMLKKPGGVSIAEVMKDTGWLSHSCQGFFSGVVKTKLKYTMDAEGKGDQRRYRITGGGPK